MFCQKVFDSNLTRWSVRSQIRAKMKAADRWRTVRVSFRDFTDKRVVWSNWNQKQSCITLQELSNGIKLIEIQWKFTPEIEFKPTACLKRKSELFKFSPNEHYKNL